MYTLFNEEGTALAEAHQWTDRFVCGIDAERCVLKKAVDAFEHGIRAWLLTDASASHSGQPAHDAGVLVAEKMIGRLQTIRTAEVERSLFSA